MTGAFRKTPGDGIRSFVLYPASSACWARLPDAGLQRMAVGLRCIWNPTMSFLMRAFLGARNATMSCRIRRFAAGWEGMFEQLDSGFGTWEAVLAEIEDESLNRFYRLCKRFNREYERLPEAITEC